MFDRVFGQRGHRAATANAFASQAIPSEEWGETPLGFVVLREGADVDAETVRSFANARLGKTQRLSQVILKKDLPRSEIGKILKKDLRAPYWPD
jgi:acyl-CoA synthetase (AMP-forming)/AMP-acid ligase II